MSPDSTSTSPVDWRFVVVIVQPRMMIAMQQILECRMKFIHKFNDDVNYSSRVVEIEWILVNKVSLQWQFILLVVEENE